MCISTPTVLADQNDCYDQHGGPCLITYRVSLGLYTQLNIHRVFLVCGSSTFDPKNKMILFILCSCCLFMWRGIGLGCVSMNHVNLRLQELECYLEFSLRVFPCFTRSLCKSAEIVLTTGFLGCIVSCGSWMCATGTICRVGRQVFACLDLSVYYYCLFGVGVVRLVRLVVPIAMVTASLALL